MVCKRKAMYNKNKFDIQYNEFEIYMKSQEKQYCEYD